MITKEGRRPGYVRTRQSETCNFKCRNSSFDVVIADPPAFIPKRKDKKAGEIAYQRLNQLAMRLLE